MESTENLLTLDGASLGIDQLARIARDPAVKVRIAPDAVQRVVEGRKQIETIVEQYHAALRDPDAPPMHVYGVTTGFGEFKNEPVPPEQLVELQRNILLSHSAGAGDTADEADPANYFPAEVVRAALVLRLNTLLKGFSGVRIELVECIAAMINRGIVPLVPTRGSVGSSGDLCPLAHTFVILLGVGFFHVAETPGKVASPFKPQDVLPATELPRHLGSAPVPPSYKEGLALTNGATYSAAMLALACHDAGKLCAIADVACAMTLEAVCGRTRALDPAIHEARNLRGQQDAASNLRKLLRGSRLSDRAQSLQDAYSIRCAPQVHGASRDAVAFASMTAVAEMNAATDNPLFFPGMKRRPFDIASRLDRGDAPSELGDERAFSAGNFHGQPVALAADFLACAVAELADIAERRVQLLLDKHHNRNLPGNLVARRGVHSGFMLSQYTAASLVSENKVLAHPASVDSIPTSGNSEDHNAMATIAARKLRTVLHNAQTVLAINLLCAAQAVDWRVGRNISPNDPTTSQNVIGAVSDKLAAAEEEAVGFEEATGPGAWEQISGHLGAGTSAAYRVIRQRVPTLQRDRMLGPDIAAVRKLITSNDLWEATATAVGGFASIPRLVPVEGDRTTGDGADSGNPT
jgi:histidine ammonia-lyase